MAEAGWPDKYGQSASPLSEVMIMFESIDLIKEQFSKNNIEPEVFEDSFFPFQITWFVDLRCNLRCPYCFVPDDNAYLVHPSWHSKGIDTLKILYRLKEVGVLRLDVLGGEPFLAKQTLLTLAREAFGLGIAYKSTSTNGLIYDEEIVTALRAMDEFGIQHILQVSVDAASPRTYRKVRGADLFLRVVDNIKRFVDAGLHVELGMVLTKHNIHEIESFAEMAKNLGVEMISFGGFMPLGRGKSVQDWHLSYKEMIRAYEVISNLDDIRIIMPKEVSDRTCAAGIGMAAMAPNGDLYPCNMFLSMPEARLGNIFDDKLNKSNNLWYWQMVSYRVPAECDACDLPPICDGACKAVIYDHFGKFESDRPLCYLWGRRSDVSLESQHPGKERGIQDLYLQLPN